MDLLGIGYQEIVLVLVLMLVVVGPERLPAVAYQIGRAVRTLQQYARAVRDEFGDEIGYIEEQYKTVKGEIDTTRTTLRQEQAKFETELRDSTTVNLDATSPGSPTNVVPFPDPTRTASTTTADEPVQKEETAERTPPLVF